MSSQQSPYDVPPPSSANDPSRALLDRSAHGGTIALVVSFVLGLLFAVMSRIDLVEAPGEFADEPQSPAAMSTRHDLASGDELEVYVVAPSAWLDQVKPGSAFRFHATDTGRILDARVMRLGPVADPQAQTIRVVGTLSAAERASIHPGTRGRADFGAVGAVPASIGRNTERPPRPREG